MGLPNIHPMIVHFPIACLMIYTVLEVISRVVPRRAVSLLVTKKILLFVGVAFAWMALQTGEIAADVIGDAHKNFANMTYQTYGFLALWYLLKSVVSSWWFTAPSWLVTLTHHRRIHLVIMLIAIFGSVLLMITGALGGSMVYGPDADPMVRLIYDFLVE